MKTPNIILRCICCNQPFTGKATPFLTMEPPVCSMECFIWWIAQFSNKPLTDVTPVIHCNENDFRNDWERRVANFLTYYQIPYLYEAIAIRVGKKKYIPDFYLHDSGIYLEVKGKWYPGYKTLFVNACKQNPDYYWLLDGHFLKRIGILNGH
jgi:hypothetical protein